MRDIVVLSPGFRSWHSCVRYAAQLAASMHATLTGLYIAERSGPAAGPPLLVNEVIAYAQDELHQAVLAGRHFAEWASQLGLHEARWQVAIGPGADALLMAGNWNDLIVLQGNVPPSSGGERQLCEVLLSGTACIVIPEASNTPGRVVHAVVALNDTAASWRALHGALPLLRTAESVTLVQSHADRTHDCIRPDALSHLRAHGVSVTTVHTIPGSREDACEQLLAHVADQRADLLVMGASGRHRLGEYRLGPITGSVLSRSHIPVFFKH